MSSTTVSVGMEDSILTIRLDRDSSRELSLTEMSCLCVAADPGLSGRVYCGTAGGELRRSDDGGVSWHVVGGLRDRQVTAVAVSPIEPGADGSRVVYIGTEPSAVFRLSDGGEHWEELETLLNLPSAPTWSFPPRPHTHHVRWIALDPLVAGRLFVAIEAGALVRSEDGGRSWHDRVPSGPIDTHSLVVHRSDPTRLYSAAGDGYFESRDGGLTWQKQEDGLRHRYAWGCVVDPEDPETMLVIIVDPEDGTLRAPRRIVDLSANRRRAMAAHRGRATARRRHDDQRAGRGPGPPRRGVRGEQPRRLQVARHGQVLASARGGLARPLSEAAGGRPCGQRDSRA